MFQVHDKVKTLGGHVVELVLFSESDKGEKMWAAKHSDGYLDVYKEGRLSAIPKHPRFLTCASRLECVTLDHELNWICTDSIVADRLCNAVEKCCRYCPDYIEGK